MVVNARGKRINGMISCERKTAPVFIVGCPRSGTTLLYDTLLSAGGFALYFGESNVFNLLAPRFGDLSIRKNREKMLDVWLGSRLFRATGLQRGDLEARIPESCRNAGDFLRAFMDEIAHRQNAWRWAGNSPEEILHLEQIKKSIPEALIIHIIRDGRDVSLSLSQKRFLRPFPWKDRETLEGAALYWEWIVQKGRNSGARLGNDYIEVRFEELVGNPRLVLQRLSIFLGQELDYERIRKTAIGSLAHPNTSFTTENADAFNPLYRWKRQIDAARLSKIEALVGNTLDQLGYELSNQAHGFGDRAYVAWTRIFYRQFFEFKLQSKKNGLMRALRPALTPGEVDRTVVVDDHALEHFAALAGLGYVSSLPEPRSMAVNA